MTPQEFKAWFDGFTEAFGSRIPTKAQWARVKERVAEIDGRPVTERIYVDRYYPYYRDYFRQTFAGTTGGYTGNSTTTVALSAGSNCYNNFDGAQFDSLNAMTALGRNEAAALS